MIGTEYRCKALLKISDRNKDNNYKTTKKEEEEKNLWGKTVRGTASWELGQYLSLTLLVMGQGTVKGGRRQGSQRKRWEDIKEWTGLEFAKSQRAVENREKWRKLVVKSSVVP